jgi:hypothetical protein
MQPQDKAEPVALELIVVPLAAMVPMPTIVTLADMEVLDLAAFSMLLEAAELDTEIIMDFLEQEEAAKVILEVELAQDTAVTKQWAQDHPAAAHLAESLILAALADQVITD